MSEKSDTTPEHDVQILAGEFVLGTLSPEQRVEVQQRMTHDPALRRAIHDWEARLLAMTDITEPQPPFSRLRNRLERSLGDLSIAKDSVTRPKRKRSSRWWNSVGFWRRLAGLGLIGSLLLGTQLLTQVSPTGTPSWLAVLSTPQDKTPGWVLQINDSREIQLIPLGSTQVPEDQVLQFWTQMGDRQGLVSLGRVRRGEMLKVRLNTLPPLQPDQLFELTLEKANGPIVMQPTGPIQFIGRAVKVL